MSRRVYMCGVAGFFNISQPFFFVDNQLLMQMQNRLKHRGPDGYRTWANQNHELGLVHRRLSIMDLSESGAQPMLDDERLVLVACNGEIYNHPQLRVQLEQRGYTYRSNSDTETLLYAYKEWGIQALEKLDGMFAIIIYDFKKKELYLVRDRMGIKPLYFSLQEGVLSFASEIKALWCLPWITRSFKQDAAYHYLTYLATPAPMTLYEGIYKLPSSYVLKVDAQKQVTFSEWYTPLKPAIIYTSSEIADEQFCIEQTRTLLSESIRQQMMSDVPYGVLLSGGIDSSLNVALMSRYTDRINTFTVACADGPEYNELAWARRVAGYFNTRHHEVIITEKEAYDFFSTMVYHQDEPLGDCVCVPLYYVAQLAKNSGVTVVQVGEGSDELFCGYNLYADYLRFAPLFETSQRYIPAYARSIAYRFASTLFPKKFNRLDALRNWANNREFFWSGAVVFSEQWKKEFISLSQSKCDPIIQAIYPRFEQILDSHTVAAYHCTRLRQYDPRAEFLKMLRYTELKHRLPELLLMRVDKMTMAASVEGRVPFLDHKLVEFALQIPGRLLYKNGQTKYLLKKACEGILPSDIIYRKKMGFAAPTRRWFKQGDYFPALLQDLLHDQSNQLTEYMDITFIMHMLKDTQESTVDYSYQLWALQNLLACARVQ